MLRGDEARHAAVVLRLRPGEPLRLADGSGRVAQAVVIEVAPTEVSARVLTLDAEPRPGPPELWVAVGIPKAGKLDLVVQKLTELGVEAIAPVACARSVVRWDAARSRAAADRLAGIARAAAKQSRRPRVPRVLEVATLAARLPELPRPLVVCWEAATPPLRQVLPEAPPASLSLLIGPEGGLEPAEVAATERGGAMAASLGPLVLRAETAAIAATAAVRYHYGQLG